MDFRHSTGGGGRSSTPGPMRPAGATSPQTPRSSSTDLSSGRSAAHIIRSAEIYSWKIRRATEDSGPVNKTSLYTYSHTRNTISFFISAFLEIRHCRELSFQYRAELCCLCHPCLDEQWTKMGIKFIHALWFLELPDVTTIEGCGKTLLPIPRPSTRSAKAKYYSIIDFFQFIFDVKP